MRITCFLPVVSIGVGDKEIINIPKHQVESSSCFVRFFISEKQIVIRILGNINPAHDVNADSISTFIKFDGVPPGFVHRATVFSENRSEAKYTNPGGTPSN